MKTISLWQPYASLIAIGAKKIETRGWPTKYRGPLAIHAAKKWDRDVKETILSEPFRRALIEGGCTLTSLPGCDAITLPLGKVVCVCELTDCALVELGYLEGKTKNYDWPEHPESDFGNYGLNRFAWILSNVRKLSEPIPWVGRQGFFDVPDELFEPAALAGLEMPR